VEIREGGPNVDVIEDVATGRGRMTTAPGIRSSSAVASTTAWSAPWSIGLSADEPFVVPPDSAPFCERSCSLGDDSFCSAKFGTTRPMANPSARATWSFMIYTGSSRRAAFYRAEFKSAILATEIAKVEWPSDAPRSKGTRSATKFCGIALRWLKIDHTSKPLRAPFEFFLESTGLLLSLLALSDLSSTFFTGLRTDCWCPAAAGTFLVGFSFTLNLRCLPARRSDAVWSVLTDTLVPTSVDPLIKPFLPTDFPFCFRPFMDAHDQ
jgi:hypothetical protein